MRLEKRTFGTIAMCAALIGAASFVGCGSDTNSDNGAAVTGGTGMAGGSGGASANGGSAGSANTGGSENRGTIVDVAAANPDFSSLLAAVRKAELVETLSGAGPFTVFAPTNAAFSALFSRLGTTLESLRKEDLIPILTYHVVAGAVSASQVVGLKVATTVNGADFRISVEGQSVRLLTGAASPVLVTATDVQASNGVIHVIDAVMLPPGNIPAVAMANENLSTLVSALVRANLVDALSGPGPFTVFAPTNAAFAALLASNPAWDSVNDIPVSVLGNVLRYHVVAAKLYSEQVVTMSRVDTLAEAAVTIDATSGVKLNGDANVTVVDVLAKNGVVHVIDKVLLPPM